MADAEQNTHSLRTRADHPSWRRWPYCWSPRRSLLLLHQPAEAQQNNKATSNLALSSPNPGELVITWDAPTETPDDYRVTWKKSDGKWPSYKNANTVEGGNAFPTGTSHTVTGLEEGTAYQARVRARYHSGGKVEQSGPWSETLDITVAATPPRPPAKPTGLSTSPSHDNVVLSWTDPGDGSISGYQVLRGPDRDNLAVLTGDTGSATTSYTDGSVTAETTYAYAIRAKNSDGLSPESDPVAATTPAAPAPPAKPTGLSTTPSHDSVDLSWSDPNDSSITSYQVLRGPDTDNLAVLEDNTGSSSPSYTDSTVAAETTYAYAVRARNTGGLSPPAAAVSVTTPATPALPAKPAGLLAAATHSSVLLVWTDPGDDTITGYQVLRGPDAANMAVLDDDTGSTGTSYTDSTVSAETTYAYAIRARNAAGLGPQSDTVSVTTQAAPEELLTELATAGVDFILDGHMLDTTSTCTESEITSIVEACTINITSPTVQITIDGTKDVDDRIKIKVGRDKAAVDAETAGPDQNNFPSDGSSTNLSFQPGRNLLSVWGDEDGSGSTAPTEHFFRINLVPYWEWNGNTLSKDSDCRDTTANAPAVGDITDDDCIVAPQFGNTAELRFFNVINEHFNVYVEVNETNVINEPSTTDLGSSFSVNLDAGDNLIRIRLAAKGGQPTAEVYDSDSFYYKVTATDVLVSNLGQSGAVTVLSAEIQVATQFTTGSNPNGYTVSQVRLPISVAAASITPVVSIYSDVSGSPGASIKTLTNPSITVSSSTAPEAEFGADDYKLTANTTYWIVVENPDTSLLLRTSTTVEDSEDAGGAPNWSIGNVSRVRSTGGTFSDLFASRVMQIAVKGALVPPVSSDATLSSLVLTDPDNTVVTLDPTFESGVESYTATVANAVSQIKVEPTKNDDTATVQYLDSNDMALTDADTNTGVFDVDLAEGDNVIKVEVTAEDTTTTKTYQVTVTRVDFLVSNLGQTDFGNFGVNSSRPALGVKFTTGSSAGGYKIDSVPLVVSAPSGTIPEVSIYSDNSGEPGSSIKVLKNPSNIPTSLGPKRNFDAADYQLDPSTSYWIVIERRSGTDQISVRITGDTEEDPGSAPGWNIGDRAAAFDSASWTSSTTSTLKLAVKGEPITPVITLAADFTSIIRELHELTFTLTRTGSTALAADVTLVVENAAGDSVVSASGRTETLTFQVGDDTVEFAVPESWIAAAQAGSFEATVEAGPEYDASGATATVEVLFPTALMEISLDKTSYEVTEGEDLTFNVVFNVLEQIAAPNKEFVFGTLKSVLGNGGESRRLRNLHCSSAGTRCRLVPGGQSLHRDRGADAGNPGRRPLRAAHGRQRAP